MRDQIASREEWLKARPEPLSRTISNQTDLNGRWVVSYRERVRASRVADWLCFAAAPTFAIMAVLTALPGAPDALCLAAHHASPLSGMIPMYLLMSTFHSAPWLNLISGRRSGARRP